MLSGEKLRLPEDWNHFVKSLGRKQDKILAGIASIPSKIEILSANRPEIMKLKTKCFGKGKITLTTISSSFQKECRPFANLLSLVVVSLQYLKKHKADSDLNNLIPLKTVSTT